MLFRSEEIAKRINLAIFPGSQGGPLMHVIAAKAVAFGEAMKPEYKEYQRNIKLNAKALAAALMSRGFDLVSGGTDNHLMLVDLRKFNRTGRDMEQILDTVNITANKNKIPNDPQNASLTSGLRLGTAAVTTRGFTEADMDIVGECIYLAASDVTKNSGKIIGAVGELCAKHPLYE